MSVTLVLQLAVLLAANAIGARAGSVGLVILVFGFNAVPGSIPVEVLLIILTMIMAASAMEALI